MSNATKSTQQIDYIEARQNLSALEARYNAIVNERGLRCGRNASVAEMERVAMKQERVASELGVYEARAELREAEAALIDWALSLASNLSPMHRATIDSLRPMVRNLKVRAKVVELAMALSV